MQTANFYVCGDKIQIESFHAKLKFNLHVCVYLRYVIKENFYLLHSFCDSHHAKYEVKSALLRLRSLQ